MALIPDTTARIPHGEPSGSFVDASDVEGHAQPVLLRTGLALLVMALAAGSLAAKPSKRNRTYPAPSAAALQAARNAHRCAVLAGEVSKPVVTLIDYSLPSTSKRLWVINLDTDKTLLHERVAHGKNSGWNHTTKFSNTKDSLATSLGVFRVAEVYTGKHGRSLRLDGLEAGFNDNARSRHVVIHGARYASKTYKSKKYGKRLGRSWGCPAVRTKVVKKLIRLTANGTLLVSYADDAKWKKTSKFLNCDGVTLMQK